MDVHRDLLPAYERAVEAGLRVRALVLINPHNPLGSVLTVRTMKSVLTFCAQRQLHIIFDEVYGLSVFRHGKEEEEEGEDEEEEKEKKEGKEEAREEVTEKTRKKRGFVSILSLDKNSLPDPQRTHFVWSLSKDFGLSGFRVGVVHSYRFVFCVCG